MISTKVNTFLDMTNTINKKIHDIFVVVEILY